MTTLRVRLPRAVLHGPHAARRFVGSSHRQARVPWSPVARHCWRVTMWSAVVAIPVHLAPRIWQA